ncbi:HWE histidine kinase domain-containing protein [Aureimonas sp. ME7]|uniref:sensor histidine kinase n=1 Tax=Aureimonas sp. ME7 TaxID=2744252 RepID=UPI0015F80BF8|nr:HWE histidine kinase domain-containing protein [Aureimonas sp. ME7]
MRAPQQSAVARFSAWSSSRMAFSSPFGRLLVRTLRCPVPRVVTYVATAVAVAIVATFRAAFITDLLPYLFFIPIIIASSLLGGRGPGVLATLLSTIPAAYAFSKDSNPFHLTSAQWSAQAMFVVVNLGIVELGSALRRAVLVFDDMVEGRQRALAHLAREVQQRSQLARIVENSSDFIGYADLDGRVQYVNEAGRDLVGLAGDPNTTVIADYFGVGEWGRIESDVLPEVIRNGAWTGDVHFRHFQTGAILPVRYNVFSLPDADGRPIGYGTVTADLRRERAAEEQRQILVSELAHRLKNTLAVTQSIATQTLRSAPDLQTARQSLTKRIQTLSRAHDILLVGKRDAGSVEAIIRSAIELHDQEGQITVLGPDLFIGPKAALTLALIMHELATNAVKYGALSVPHGRVEVSWVVDVALDTKLPTLTLNWREVDGPPASPPTRKGFGTRLIEMGLSGSTGGSVELDYAGDGLKCRIVAPLTELQADDEA